MRPRVNRLWKEWFYHDRMLMDYTKALEIAKQKGDKKKITKLKKNGVLPYYGRDVSMKSFEYIGYLDSYMGKNKEIYNSNYDLIKYLFSSEYGIIDKYHFIKGFINTELLSNTESSDKKINQV